MTRSKYERGTDLENVVVQSIPANQHAPVAHAIHDRTCFARRRLACGSVAHELHHDEQTRASHVADDGVS